MLISLTPEIARVLLPPLLIGGRGVRCRMLKVSAAGRAGDRDGLDLLAREPRSAAECDGAWLGGEASAAQAVPARSELSVRAATVAAVARPVENLTSQSVPSGSLGRRATGFVRKLMAFLPGVAARCWAAAHQLHQLRLRVIQ